MIRTKALFDFIKNTSQGVLFVKLHGEHTMYVFYTVEQARALYKKHQRSLSQQERKKFLKWARYTKDSIAEKREVQVIQGALAHSLNLSFEYHLRSDLFLFEAIGNVLVEIQKTGLKEKFTVHGMTDPPNPSAIIMLSEGTSTYLYIVYSKAQAFKAIEKHSSGLSQDHITGLNQTFVDLPVSAISELEPEVFTGELAIQLYVYFRAFNAYIKVKDRITASGQAFEDFLFSVYKDPQLLYDVVLGCIRE